MRIENVSVHLGSIIRIKGRHSDQKFVEKRSQSVEIHCSGVLARLQHLWRHILRRATDRERPRSESELVLRKPKISQFDMPVHIQQHVFRLQIAIHNIVIVEVFEAEKYFQKVEFSRLLWEGTVFVQMEEELTARAEFHQNVEVVARLEEGVGLHEEGVVGHQVDALFGGSAGHAFGVTAHFSFADGFEREETAVDAGPDGVDS